MLNIFFSVCSLVIVVALVFEVLKNRVSKSTSMTVLSVVAPYLCCSGCFQGEKWDKLKGRDATLGHIPHYRGCLEPCGVMAPKMHGGWLWRVGGRELFTAGFKTLNHLHSS